jgi:hypothetical protein
VSGGPVRRRRLVIVVSAAGVAFAAMAALFPAGAAAEIGGPCTASINGVSVAGRSLSPGDAIDVSQHAAVPVTMSAGREISHYSISLAFGGFSWTVKNKDTSSNSWSSSVPVDSYATYGVGLYQVSGNSTGPGGLVCTGAALVKVSGDPLSTVAGDVGLGASVLGAVGLLGAAAAAGGTGKARRSIDQWTVDQIDGLNKAEGQQATSGAARESDTVGDNIDFAARLVGYDGFCFWLTLSALILTTGAMIGGGGGSARTSGGTRLARAHWRPRLSAIGLASGVLGGFGVAILLQEYAVLFPTRTVAIAELAIGLALGLVLPSLGRALGVGRVNAALAQAERRLAAARAKA